MYDYWHFFPYSPLLIRKHSETAQLLFWTFGISSTRCQSRLDPLQFTASFFWLDFTITVWKCLSLSLHTHTHTHPGFLPRVTIWIEVQRRETQAGVDGLTELRRQGSEHWTYVTPGTNYFFKHLPQHDKITFSSNHVIISNNMYVLDLFSGFKTYHWQCKKENKHHLAKFYSGLVK